MRAASRRGAMLAAPVERRPRIGWRAIRK